MTDLIDRYCELKIGDAGKTGLLISDLLINIKIDKFKDSTPNTLELSITNLDPAIRGAIKKDQVIQINAGYESDHGVIFTGFIDKISNTNSRPDYITKIECKDGLKNILEALAFKTFSANTKVSTVINYLIEQLGVSKGTLSGIPSEAKFNNSVTLANAVKYYLDTYAKTYNFKWSIQDGFIHILKPTEKINNIAIDLDEGSGLLTDLEPTEKGFKCRSLLRWSLNPSNYVKIKKGFYIVQNLTHSGDNKSGGWYTDLEVIKA